MIAKNAVYLTVSRMRLEGDNPWVCFSFRYLFNWGSLLTVDDTKQNRLRANTSIIIDIRVGNQSMNRSIPRLQPRILLGFSFDMSTSHVWPTILEQVLSSSALATRNFWQTENKIRTNDQSTSSSTQASFWHWIKMIYSKFLNMRK